MDSILKNTFTYSSALTLGIIIGANRFLPETLIILSIMLTAGATLLSLKARRLRPLRKIKNWTPLDESNTLFEASLFRCVLAVFCLLALSYSTIEITSHSISEHTHMGEYFYAVFRKPVIVFSLSLPIIALIANHHRSLQTHKQIETSKENNYFNNYLKHLEQFKEYINDRNIFSKNSAITINPNELHGSIYSSSLEGNLKTGREFNKKIEDFKTWTERLIETVNNIKTSKEPKIDLSEAIEEIEDTVYLIDQMFSIKIIYDTFTITEHQELHAVIFNFHRAFNQLHELSNFMFTSEANQDLMKILSNIRKLKRMLMGLKSQNISTSS